MTGPPRPMPADAPLVRLLASDGRIGRVLALACLVAPVGIWFPASGWASERIDGSVTLFCVLSGFMLLGWGMAIRMRVHDMAGGRVTRALIFAAFAIIAVCLVQSAQAGRRPAIVGGLALLVLAVTLLRPGVARETAHGTRPATLRRTRPRTPPRRRGAVFAIIWMLAWLALGAFIEENMHEYRRAVDRRVAAASPAGW